jgi:hypothetical protein
MGPDELSAIKSVSGRGTYSLGVKRPESEADCSSSASEQNEWSCMPHFIPALGQLHLVFTWRSNYFARFHIPRMMVIEIQVLWNITYRLDKFR